MAKFFAVNLIIASIIVAGIVGNSLVIWTIIKTKLYQKKLYILILTLALADLLDELLMLPAYGCILTGVSHKDVPFLNTIGFGSPWWGFALIQAHFTDIVLLTAITLIQAIALDKKGWFERNLNTWKKMFGLVGFLISFPFVFGTWLLLPGFGISKQIYNESQQQFNVVHQSPFTKQLMFILFNLISLTFAGICIVCDVIIIRKILAQQRTLNAASLARARESSQNLAKQFVGINIIYLTFIGSMVFNFVPISTEICITDTVCFKWDLVLRGIVTHSIYASNFYFYLLFNRSFRNSFRSAVGLKPLPMGSNQGMGPKTTRTTTAFTRTTMASTAVPARAKTNVRGSARVTNLDAAQTKTGSKRGKTILPAAKKTLTNPSSTKVVPLQQQSKCRY